MIIRSGESYINTDKIIKYESTKEREYGVIKIYFSTFGLNLAYFETLEEAKRILKDIIIAVHRGAKYYFIESEQLIDKPDPNEIYENLIN